MSSRWGMDQGFEEYLCRRPRHGRRAARQRQRRSPGDRTSAGLVRGDAVLHGAGDDARGDLLARAARRRHPFFLFLNYMDVHLPNSAPGSQGLAFEDEAPVMGRRRTSGSTAIHAGGALSPAERRSFVNEYDRELIYLDHWVGVLFEHLESSGLADRTMVVLTSDHGEFLGEHELIGHRKDLYAEVVDVPLIVWEPGRRPDASTRPVQSLDVFPTILRYLGLPIPPRHRGRRLLEADHPTVSELHYALHSMLLRPRRRALRPHPQDDPRRRASLLPELHGRRAALPPARRPAGDPQPDRRTARPGHCGARAASRSGCARHRRRHRPWTRRRRGIAEALENLRALGYVR